MKISLKLVPEDQIDKQSLSVHMIAWRRTDSKPLPEPMITMILYAILLIQDYNRISQAPMSYNEHRHFNWKYTCIYFAWNVLVSEQASRG